MHVAADLLIDAYFGTGDKHKKKKGSKRKHKDAGQAHVAAPESDIPDVSGKRSRAALQTTTFDATKKC